VPSVLGAFLVIVSQPASIGALPLILARDAGCKVAYLPGLTMRRIADLYPGEAKTDAKEAGVIDDAARTMPHTLRSLEVTDEITAELTVLVGFDQDLAAEATRTSNRIRGLLTQFHPTGSGRGGGHRHHFRAVGGDVFVSPHRRNPQVRAHVVGHRSSGRGSACGHHDRVAHASTRATIEPATALSELHCSGTIWRWGADSRAGLVLTTLRQNPAGRCRAVPRRDGGATRAR
jgi:hypothetical protein